jgi:hypothetical protein
MSGHIFHPGHEELHGITVVVETRGSRTYVGRYDSQDNQGVHMFDVGVHDERAAAGGLSKEEYIRKSAKFGIRSEHKHLIVPSGEVVRVVRLGDVS